jgi:hypothetical protein
MDARREATLSRIIGVSLLALAFQSTLALFATSLPVSWARTK